MAPARAVVVGAGILGLAVARRLQQRRPDLEVVVVEKESAVARHQSGHNSGVAHAGLYYAPGSLKARLCRRGQGLLAGYCAERGLPYEECGKLVVAVDDTELGRLRDLEARARANGVPDLRWLGPGALRDVEPHAVGVAALHSPRTAIVDFAAVARALADDVAAAGGTVRLSWPVARIDHRRGTAVVMSSAGEEIPADHLVLCAGLQSDRVARLAGDGPDPAVVPFRGEYLRLVRSRRELVRGLVYPVPDPRYPFLGVHFTRRVDGNVDVGPNAVLALAREGYRRSQVGPADLWDTVRYPGFRRLARAHWRTGLREIRGSLSTRAFVEAARRYVPELRLADVEPAPAGVRAQAVERDGTLVDDFRIRRIGAAVAVRNAPSPGATSSLAIAEHIAAQVLDGEGGRAG